VRLVVQLGFLFVRGYQNDVKTEMVAGHGGVSGRYKGWRELAFEYAWLVDQIAS